MTENAALFSLGPETCEQAAEEARHIAASMYHRVENVGGIP